MKLYFDIEGLEYETIDSDDLSLEKYFNIMNVIEKEEDIYITSKEIFRELVNIEDDVLDQLDEFKISLINWNIYILDLYKFNNIKINYGKYKLKKPDNLKFGNFVDIEYFYNLDKKDKIIDVVALLILPDDYKMEDFEEAKQFVNSLSVKGVISIYNLYLEFKNSLIKEHKYLFGISDSEEEPIELTEEEKKEQEKEKTSWNDTAFMLTNKDISKLDTVMNMNVKVVLNYLSWLKAENQREIMEMKKIRNK